MNVVIDMLMNKMKAMCVNSNTERQYHCGKRRFAGFTMAEMLIVVAIIGVLAGVSFVAVQAHQKNMTQLQYDSIAKEIFVAAQNHLTLAKSENYRQTSDLTAALNNKTATDSFFFGPDGDAEADKVDDIRYFYSGGSNTGTALEQILPFGAIELVSGGSYIIRYQPNAARVLDVFYWTDGISKYDANLGSDDYQTLVGSDDTKDKHKNYSGDGLLGWCGGESAIESGAYLEAPEIEVINEEMLLVTVTDKNVDSSKVEQLKPKLKLIVSGNLSGAKMAIPLDYTSLSDRVKPDNVNKIFTIVLDDITSEKKMHFFELNGDPNFIFLQKNSQPVQFIPGENITVQAVAYSNDVLTNVAYSGEWTTNSLFAEVSEKSSGTASVADQVDISNIRHLENLNDSISGVAYGDAFFSNAISAVQTVDLDWTNFITTINERNGDDATNAINIYDKDGKKSKADCYLPVTVTSGYALTYDGQSSVSTSVTTGTGNDPITTTTTVSENHSITGIVVDNTEATGSEYTSMSSAGLVGSLTGATIKNLELIDFSIKVSAGDAGTLAGALTGSTVENVVAYNSTNATTTNVETASGNAGGLIGSMNAKTGLSKCAAAVIVNSTSGNAGGLVGSVGTGTACSVTGCYSGGHTVDKKNGTDVIGVIYEGTPDGKKYDVTSTASAGFAGGLIGNAESTVIQYSYSTCSATGATVGGLIGSGSGEITDSYCTGLVKSTASTSVEGAFAGKWTFTGQTDDDKNYYFEIINEREEKDADGNPTGGYSYLPSVSGATEPVKGITAMDQTATTFNDFSNPGTTGYAWQDAKEYNPTLKAYYGEGTGTARITKYNLRTVEQLFLLNEGYDPATDLTVQHEDTTSAVKTPADFVIEHYGDWPAPEIFVVNTKQQ